MKAIVTNKLILLSNPTKNVKLFLHKILSYKDKSKQFQLNRMKRNPFHKGSNHLKQLEKEVFGQAYQELPNGDMVFSSGLLHYLKDIDIEDRRCSTGATIPMPWKDKPFTPRPYQEEALDVMDNNKRGIINLATGLGKTLVAIHSIKRHRTKTLVIVPSDSIARQFVEDAENAFGSHRVAMYGGGKKKTADITIAIAASVVKNPEVFGALDLGLVIYDEVHHIAANTFFEISKNLGNVGKVFGLTATDYRGDGKDILIEAGCGKTLIRRDIVWGVKNNWLAKPIFIIKEINTLGTDFSDKLKSYKEHVLNNNDTKKMIYNDIKNAIENQKSTLCLVAEVEHGKELSEQLGIPFAQGSDKKSQEYVKQLNANKINGLVGTTGKVGEGTDTKNVEALVMANFMAGKGVVIQSLGRGLRLVDGKTECISYDYIPTGSSILKRHALGRIKFYREITDDITIIKADDPILKL